MTRARFPFVGMCRANTRLNCKVQTRKFERGIAEKLKMIVITCVMYGNRVLAISLDGWRFGTETDIGLLVASSAMSAPIFSWIGNDYYGGS